MKNIVNLLLFLFVFLSACSDDSILEELKPEPPKSDVEEPKPDDDSENSGDNQNSVLPILNVVGRYLKNEKGEIINLHGFTQTYSPFFNNNAWNDYDVQAVSIIIRVWWTEFWLLDGSLILFECILILIGAMILLCSLYGMRDTSASPKLVSGSILMNCLYRWRNILCPRACT